MQTCRHKTYIAKLIMNDHRFDPSSLNDNRALGNACESGNMEMVKLIVENTSYNTKNLNKICKYDKTLFMLACMHKNFNVAEYLFNHKSFNSLNTTNKYRESAFSSNLHEIETIKYLLKKQSIIIPEESILNEKKPYLSFRYHDLESRPLIESYKKNPILIRKLLILDDNLDIYRHIIFFCDDFYCLNQNDSKTNNATRFFLLMKQFPVELQMIMVYRLSGSKSSSIPNNVFLNNIDQYVNKYL